MPCHAKPARMGYACPVCGDPQADGHHLANHLAFTAMLGDADHEAWLDERAPDWADADVAELAATVTDDAEEADYPQVFEDSGDPTHDHGHAGHGGDRSDAEGASADASSGGPGDVDTPETVDDAGECADDVLAGAHEDVLAEARELTRRRRARADGIDGETDAEQDANDETGVENGESDDRSQ